MIGLASSTLSGTFQLSYLCDVLQARERRWRGEESRVLAKDMVLRKKFVHAYGVSPAFLPQPNHNNHFTACSVSKTTGGLQLIPPRDLWAVVLKINVFMFPNPTFVLLLIPLHAVVSSFQRCMKYLKWILVKGEVYPLKYLLLCNTYFTYFIGYYKSELCYLAVYKLKFVC